MKTQTENGNNVLENILKNFEKIIIAGPCSAETEVQVIETAKALAADGRVNFLRAGIWKPRTSPGNFEGVGEEGFKWLNKAKAITGLPVATEVGSERHVYQALKHGVDMLWIGARTVSNPFTVQEIAEAIRGVNIPVLVKNPLSPDLNLWEGAINRLSRSGIQQVGAIHRGFSQTEKAIFRNNPCWDIPIMLKQHIPNIPLICDPSHIAGKDNIVPTIAHKAMVAEFNGLMVEVHPNPSQALSDAAQQLIPSQFSAMLNKLFCKTSIETYNELLAELRLEIDMLDEQLINSLANRLKVIRQIASVKKGQNLKVFQPSRWNKVQGKVKILAKQQGINPMFVKEIFSIIHNESCSLQKKLAKY